MNIGKISKKVPHNDNRMTLIAIHEKKLKEFNKHYANLQTMQNKLNKLQIEYKSLRSHTTNEAFEIKKKIEDLTKNIDEIQNRTEELDYYLKANPYIKDYKQAVNQNKGQISKKYIKECLSDNCVLTEQKNISDLKCKECGIELLLNHKEATAVCPQCGCIEEFQDNDICNEFSEEIEVLSPFSYMKINHFKEWLNMLLGRESSSPSEEVIDILLMELKKDRITDKKLITKELIRSYLKKNKLNKLYEHTNLLMYRICRIKPPDISRELENKLINMFEEILPYFEKHKPANRKNFLSYSYVLFKLCELLGQDHLLKSFTLLKCREKILEMDECWKKITNELGWQFIYTI